MSKRFFIIILILVAIITALLASSCGKSQIENSSDNVNSINSTYYKMPVYQEEIIYTGDGKEHIENVKAYSNDEFVSISTNIENASRNLVKYDSKFKNQDILVKGSFKERVLSAYDNDSNHNIYLLNLKKVEKGSLPLPEGRLINVYDYQGNNIKEVKVEDAKIIKDANWVRKIVVKNECIYIFSNSGIQVVDHNGKTITELPKHYIDADVSSDGNIIFIIKDAQQKFCREKIDTDTTKILWSLEFENFTDMPDKICCDKEMDLFYIQNNNKIEKYDTNGNYIADLIDFYKYKAGVSMSTDRFLSELFYCKENFYIILSLRANPFDIEIIKFSPLFGINADIKLQEFEKTHINTPTIKVLIPERNIMFEKQSIIYQSNNNLLIDISYYRDSPVAGKLLEDYTQYINLQIMSGVDWDIVAIRSLPYRTYIKKGILANLESISKNNYFNDDSKYFTNIFDSVKYDNELYIFPVGYTFGALLVDELYFEQTKNQLDYSNMNWIDLLSSAENMNEGSFHPMSKDTIYSLLYRAIADEIVDVEIKKADFNSELFYEFSKIVKTSSNINLYANKNTKTQYNVTETFGMQTPLSIFQGYRLLQLPFMQYSDKRVFLIQEGYAINNSSKMKQESLEFIKYLADNTGYFPVSKVAYSDYMKRNSKPEYKEIINSITDIIESLNAFNSFDIIKADIASIIKEEVIKFCNDELSMEQAIEELNDKVWLYLNE